MTIEGQRCPQCHGMLPPGRTEGLCPKCLIEQGLQTSPPSLAPTQSSDRGGGLPAFVAATPEELAPNFPQLEILELLGVGGMGAVYKARQASLDRIVALKVLPLEVGQDHSFAERFTREAKALARLNHPHIVTIHDIGQANGLYYIVMEYIDGANLRQMINAQSLSPQQILALVPQLCEALQYAHDEGIVHRDIKPENILVDKRGRAKVADFGLAKILGDQLVHTSLTATQQVMGTLRYMAPEQMLGARDVDHRADLYALGVVFYELLTGDLPLGRFPLPSEKAQCDTRLDEVVLKALERERERRYQQASDIKTDVETISGSYAAKTVAQAISKAAPLSKLSNEEFEAAADEVRGPAWGLMIVSIVQFLLIVVLWGSITSVDKVWGPDHQPMRVGYSPNWFSVGLFLTLPFSLLIIAAAVQMKRLRSYEFAVIGSVLAIMPLGVTCIFTLPLGLWSLLVLLRPQVRAAFRTPVRERPGHLSNLSISSQPLSESNFEAVAAEMRPAATGMFVLGVLQLVISLGVLIAWFVVQSPWKPGSQIGDPGIMFIAAWNACLSLLYLAAGIQMRRLRNYELGMIASIVAMLPLGMGWILSAAIGLWCLLVLKRPQSQAAFRLPLRERPEPWRDNDTALLDNRERDPAAFQRAYIRVQGRCHCAGMSMLVMSALDAVAAVFILILMLTQSRGPDVIPTLILAGIPAVTAMVVAWSALCLMRAQQWGVAVVGAILCIAPLSPLAWVRWIVGIYALVTLMRADVRRGFEIAQTGGPPHDDDGSPAKPFGQRKPVYEQASDARSSVDRRLVEADGWSQRDEVILLLGVVGAMTLAAAPALSMSLSVSMAYLLVAVAAPLPVLAIAFHAYRTTQRSEARHGTGLQYDTSGHHWSDWWRNRSAWFRQTISSMAMVGFLLCVMMFLSFKSHATDNPERGLQPGSWRTTVGLPTPWLSIERHATADSLDYTQSFDLITWSVFYCIVAVALMEFVARTRRWENRTRHAGMATRGVLAGLAVLMAALLVAFVGFTA